MDVVDCILSYAVTAVMDIVSNVNSKDGRDMLDRVRGLSVNTNILLVGMTCILRPGACRSLLRRMLCTGPKHFTRKHGDGHHEQFVQQGIQTNMLDGVSLAWVTTSLSTLFERGVQHAMLNERVLQHLPRCACRVPPAHTQLQRLVCNIFTGCA